MTATRRFLLIVPREVHERDSDVIVGQYVHVSTLFPLNLYRSPEQARA
jgi:hypothetical protein